MRVYELFRGRHQSPGTNGKFRLELPRAEANEVKGSRAEGWGQGSKSWRLAQGLDAGPVRYYIFRAMSELDSSITDAGS